MRSAQNISQISRLARVPLGGGSCFAEPDIHLLSQVFARPSQKIEFVFSASPETIRREPLEIISVAQSAICGTWQPARRVIVVFLPQGAVKPPCDYGLLNAR